MERKYTSLEEIENDLRALKLKKDIDLMCLRSDYQSLLRHLSIGGLFADSLGHLRHAIVEKQKGLLSLVTSFLLRRFL